MTTVWLSVIDDRWLIIADLWSLTALLLDIFISAIVAPNLSWRPHLLLSCLALLIPTSVVPWHHLLLSCFMINYYWLVITDWLLLVQDHRLIITDCTHMTDLLLGFTITDWLPLSDYFWLMITVWFLLTAWWSLIDYRCVMISDRLSLIHDNWWFINDGSSLIGYNWLVISDCFLSITLHFWTHPPFQLASHRPTHINSWWRHPTWRFCYRWWCVFVCGKSHSDVRVVVTGWVV